jgi:hypothetical protein
VAAQLAVSQEGLSSVSKYSQFVLRDHECNIKNNNDIIILYVLFEN